MLKAVEAIIEPDGTIRILEPLQVKVPTRAIITILEELPKTTSKRRLPVPELAGKIKTIGDIVSPIVDEDDWECLK